MNSSDFTILPVNFRHEKEFLLNNNFDSWQKIRNLSDSEINKIIKLMKIELKHQLQSGDLFLEEDI